MVGIPCLRLVESCKLILIGFLPNRMVFLQCAMKGEGNRVEVERLPHLSELAHEGQAVEIASVQDPETGATR
jgi:hypothetical protein